MDYPVTLERDDNGTILVSFPDSRKLIRLRGRSRRPGPGERRALATAIDAYIKDRRDIPLPSAVVARHKVTTPSLVEAKLRLYEVMRARKVNKSELARRLDWHPPQVDRLLEMTHASRLEQIESAFAVLGKRLVVVVEDVTIKKPRMSGRRRVAGRRSRALKHR